MKRSLIYIVLTFILAIVLFTYFFKGEPRFKNDQQRLTYYIEAGQFDLAEDIYLKQIEANPTNIDLYYQMISNHFMIPYVLRDDEFLFNHLMLMAEMGNETQKDACMYAGGLMFSMINAYAEALELFSIVEDRGLKYLNNSIGRVYFEKGEIDSALIFFELEITNQGNLAGAYGNIANLLYQQQDYEKLNEYIKNKESRRYIPFNYKRYIYLTKFRIGKYIAAVIVNNYQNVGLISFLGALFVMIFYLVYLRKIDIYEPEKWKIIIIVFLMGAFFSELTFVLSDYLSLFTGFRMNGEILNDLIYCIVGIGVIEELVKIIPLLLLLKFTDEANEPVDYIIYASISALGFAFAENLLYFDNYGAQIIFGRTLTAVVFHMFLSSLIAYGIVRSKYKARKNLRWSFILFFLLAAIIHGLYDFWLINEKVRYLSLLSMIIFVVCLAIFNTLITNSLSNSNFYDSEIRINNKHLKRYLLYSLSAILLFQYFIVSLQKGSATGMWSLKQSLYSGGYLVLFLTSNLGRIRLFRGVWKPFDIRLPKFRHHKENLDNVVKVDFSILPYSKSTYIDKLLPNSGIIAERIEFSGEKDWYLLKFDHIKGETEYCNKYVIVRPRYRDKPLVKEKKVLVGFYIIPDINLFWEKNIDIDDLIFRGWALMESIEN